MQRDAVSRWESVLALPQDGVVGDVTFGRDLRVREVSSWSCQAVTPFAAIFARAATRKGGAPVLEGILAATAPLSPPEIAATPDDRILAEMTRRIFYAGFSSRVIDDKWPAFEKGFDGFGPNACAFMSAEHFDGLVQDRGIVRNGAKIKSVQTSAKFLLELKTEYGSAAQFFADWPDSDYAGLLDVLRKRARHLGGDAAGRFLRAIGKPAFITSPDMVAALIGEGVIDRAPTGKRDLAVIQNALNHWSAESGRDLTAISRVLAMSVDSVGGRAFRPEARAAAKMTSDPLRREYEARVMALRRWADAMRQDGLPPEAIARMLHAERRRLCEVFKERTPEPQRTRILQRTRAVYGDPFGPSLEHLRARGKNWGRSSSPRLVPAAHPRISATHDDVTGKAPPRAAASAGSA
jgi:3-methyladenine DNA glycosylase Tag